MRCHSSGGPFALDATFRAKPALTGEPGFISYESVNFPGRYISHRSFHLRIEHAEDSTLHRTDASFRCEVAHSASSASSMAMDEAHNFIIGAVYEQIVLEVGP